MVFPLYDDNTDRVMTPIVNYILIAINILVFVLFQQLGTNDKFTYAFSTVPQEIVSGRDVVTPDRVVERRLPDNSFCCQVCSRRLSPYI